MACSDVAVVRIERRQEIVKNKDIISKEMVGLPSRTNFRRLYQQDRP